MNKQMSHASVDSVDGSRRAKRRRTLYEQPCIIFEGRLEAYAGTPMFQYGSRRHYHSPIPSYRP